ncbi:MAG TPA: tetratricopeptide repeat protein, partial [Thermoanaerobaculia bacterium]|nr:tetratricopeptide repeat protein [Thermoanaerobaculia bacterium]
AVLAGRYRIVGFLAQGGMGEVYEVEDLALKERVALKTLRDPVADDETTILRFKREIQLARKVTHPNVCRIFDVARHDSSVLFLTMELLPGETLAQRIRRSGSISTDEALPIARQVAEALHAAHQAGVIHRDLKPGNVMLVESRGATRAVVTDFGLARLEAAAGADSSLTLTGGGIIGTPAYLAPEQLEGGEITPAADVYALGILLYEMLTGTLPFLADTALATAVKRLREAPVPPRSHIPGLDARWEAAILRCLEREPVARFATPLDAVSALTRPLSQTATQALRPPDPVPAPVSRPTPPRRRRLQLIGLLALILVCSAITWYRVDRWRAERRANPLGLPVGAITPRPAVAVLGFKNLSGDPGTAWLSTALAEMLSTELGAGGNLRVINGENVARAKVELGLGDADSLARDTLGRLRTVLGTDAVVLGSYLALDNPDAQGGRQIRLDLRLQDAAAGETTATVSETGTEAQLFALVSKVSRRLRQTLDAGDPGNPGDIEAGAVRAALPSHPEAARLYAGGINKLRLFDPVGARDLLARAVAVEPGNALVHSGLAAAWAALGYDGKAREEAKAAVDRSANLPREERLLIQGRYREAVQDWNKAVEIYWQLWSMFPDNLDHGLRLAAVQTSAGRIEEALATVDALRGLPEPSRDDLRIDLAEATAAGALADFKRQQEAAARAAQKARAQEAPLMTAQALLLECRALRNVGQAARALAACGEGRTLYSQVGDRSGVAESALHAANVRYDRGELPAALQLYEEALGIYREIGNRGAEAGALNNIAVVLKSQGDLERARQLYEEVLSVSREIGSKGGEAYALNNLAGVLLRRGELDRARELFQQSLAIRREQRDRSGEAYALDNIGVALRRRGQLAEARRHHEQALRIRRETGQKIGEVASLNNLGAVLLDQGELKAAREHFRTSLSLSSRLGNKSPYAHALFGIGEVLAAEGQLAEARKRHEAALGLRQRLGEKGTAAESRLALAGLSLESGDPARADGLARAAAEELRRQGATDGEALALSISALAARGDAAAARGAIERAAILLANAQDLRTRLIVQLRAARLGPAGPVTETTLRGIAGQAGQAGFLGIQLEAELALAEAALRQGRAAEGQARLATLQQQSEAMGYGLIARQARQARQAATARSTQSPAPPPGPGQLRN